MSGDDEQFHSALNEACRESFDTFAQRAFREVEPATAYEWNWHIGCMAEHLQYCFDKQIRRLIVNEPPRCLKSFMFGQAFPAWGMGKHPPAKFINTSYAHSVVEQNARRCKTIMKSPWYRQVFPETRIDPEFDRITHFETTQKGQYYGDTVLSSLTGMGCFVAGTKVQTDRGLINIEDLHQAAYIDTRVLSYSHDEQKHVLKRIVGFSEKESSDIIEIRTTSGRKFRCTANHPIFVQSWGYREAGSIREGEILISAGGASMHSLQKDIHSEDLRSEKEAKEGRNGRLLQQEMLQRSSCSQECSQMPRLLKQNSWGAQEILLNALSKLEEFAEQNLPRVLQGISPLFVTRDLLFKNVRGFPSFQAYARQGESQIQRRNVIQFRFPKDKADHSQTGWVFLRSLRTMLREARQENESGGSSHRRESVKQRTGQSDNDVRFVPYNSSQVTFDTVSSVERVSCGKVKVYDLTVEDTHNYYADGFLAHNCHYMVVDDPIKPMEALSDTVRLSTNANLRGTLFSRFDDKREGVFIMIMQRLHEDDPTGHLLADGGWHHLKLPARAHKPILIVLGKRHWLMKKGDLLFPARLTPAILDQDLKDMGPYHYAGQMLQEPVPIAGGELRVEWLKYYKEGGINPKRMNVYILVDAAGGGAIQKRKKKTTDFTAMAVIGACDDNNYYLLDLVRDRLNPTERINKLFELHRKWNELCGRPPKVGYEEYGLMTDLHYIDLKQNDEHYRFTVVKLAGRMSKEERIRRMIPDLQNGRWWYPVSIPYVDSEGRTFDLIREITASEIPTFPMGRFDDMIDAKSRIYDLDLNVVFPRVKDNKAAKAWKKKKRQPESWESF